MKCNKCGLPYCNCGLTNKTERLELCLEQALEYVQMVERNVTTDPRYMAHQAEQRIQSALNILHMEGMAVCFAEMKKHSDLVGRVVCLEAALASKEDQVIRITQLEAALVVALEDLEIGLWMNARNKLRLAIDSVGVTEG